MFLPGKNLLNRRMLFCFIYTTMLVACAIRFTLR